jgi:endonuclease I
MRIPLQQLPRQHSLLAVLARYGSRRATLYFLIRYPGLIGDTGRELQKARLRTLLDWHTNSPVSTYERHRNRVIFKAQGNRNPFIDHPEWATEGLLKLGFAT